MKRYEGRRGSHRRRSRVLLWLVFAVLVSFRPSYGWNIGGRFGAELDGLEERFQSSGLFDERVGEDGTIERILDVRPVLSRSTTTLGLIETRLSSNPMSPLSLRVNDIAHIGAKRARNTFRSELALRAEADRFQVEGEWDAQGGKDEPAPGSNAYLTGTWDRYRLPLRLRSQLRMGAAWSHTERAELAPILESRILRGHIELRRPVGVGGEFRGLAGYRHKEALASRIGSYDAWYGEFEADAGMGGHRWGEAIARVEDREYVADTLGIPSSRIYELTARTERSLSAGVRPYVQADFERQDFRGASDIFLDHHQVKTELGVDLYRNALRGRASSNDLPLAPDLRLRLGGEYEIFRSSRSEADSLAFDSTYDSFGAILGFSREGSEVLWFDLDLGAGRREYRNGPWSTGLVFEGLNLSLASSDFTYLRSSMLLDWAPASWIHAEALLQWEQELHDQSQDDFRLWIFNFSITHPF